MKIDGKLTESAYIYLKNHVYYENLNLFMRGRISSFEKKNKLLDEGGENIFEKIAKIISDNNTDELDKWINSISFRIIPKSFKASSQENKTNEEGRFISNDKRTDTHNPEKLNYFIDASAEVYIIDMLWSLYVGPILDGMLTEDCYGNRLRNHAKEFIKKYVEGNNAGDVSGHNNLFIRYIDQYNKWRNNAINRARLLSEDNSFGIISLDLKEFFYNVDIDLDKVEKIIVSQDIKKCSQDIIDNALKLNNLLKRIFKKYYAVVKKGLNVTHNKCKDKKILPIGLTSSSILSNWYMIDFDKKIQEKLKPIYYGRYVDDILIVLSNPIFDEKDPLKSLYKKYFVSTRILVSGNDNESYIIKGKNISIQKKKVVFQFFDKANSKAGLELFKQELDERSSAFKFLPTEQFYREMDEFAYEILFSGPSDKLRNVIGVVENETKLSQYLSSCITANRLCKTSEKNKNIVISQLMLFFKGCNSLKFSRLWEKVYQYSFVVNDIKFAIKFYNHLAKEINIISYSGRNNKFLTEKIREDLCFYNQISFSLSLALIKYPIEESPEIKKFFYRFPDLTDLMELADEFRYSNLIRHHLVAWPLSNYTLYEGNLIDENKILEDIASENQFHHEIDRQRKKYSPRFLHIDELQIFKLSQKLRCNSLSEWQAEFARMRSGFVKWKNEEEINNNKNIDKFSLSINDASRRNNYFKLAIANLIVNNEDIINALRDDEEPNLSFDRQKVIYQILNAAVKEKVDLLVLPEVSIPISWLPFMASFSRRNQIGLIFGLEHWVINKVAFNTLIELLPFSQKEGFKNCYITARVKNHYAPAELECMRSFGLVAGNGTNNRYSYHKVNWRGACFATYNCFELADITHRVLFKSEINLLIACVWNKDTNYYQHILESAVRDLHCYTIQVNTSQYGGSCVLQPTKTEQKTLLYVKGGGNPCILTTNLDIQRLRKFHYQHTPLSGDIFKPLPPGFHKP